MPRNNNFLALGNARKVAFLFEIQSIRKTEACSFFTINKVRISRSDLGTLCCSRIDRQKEEDGQD